MLNTYDDINIMNEFCPQKHCSFYDACHSNYGYCPKRLIEKVISDLDEREQYVVKMHCGFIDGKEHSFTEIGKKIAQTGI